MANLKFPLWRKALLEGNGPDLTDGNVKLSIIDLADYTYSAAHEFISSVAAGARVATATLANVTATGGNFNADDPTLPSVTGDSVEAAILWYDTTVEATSRLIAYWDAGIAVTPDGNNIVVNLGTDPFSI